ncbi:MAG: MiaB/RimO family radical SAM methylthiotransferase [Nannocystaceae bacterium]|nr:MiaB/RimO family radical SAM methylthiotransferase [Nannocystaceae bacterium]
MSIAVVGFGCRVAAAQTEAMRQALARAGMDASDDALAAGTRAVVINGCAITAAAEADARSLVRRIARERPGTAVLATGCWAHAAGASIAALPGLAAIVPLADHGAIAARVAEVLAAAPGDRTLVPATRLRRTPASSRPPLRLLPPVADARGRALLQVQDGCDYACAFCIVPQLRGGSRSLPLPEVLSRARDLVAAGAAELVLTGVHLGTWGRDLGERGGVATLLDALLSAVAGRARVRLSSLDPHELDDALVERLAAAPGLCRHLHLSVQSLDDGVLARMRRAHRAAPFLSRVRELVARVPGIAITTDVIAGHPGEDEAAFATTLARLSSLPLAGLHVFPFSPRPGTAAATMADAVPTAIVRARAARLRALDRSQRAAFRRARVGETLALVCHRSFDAHGRLPARSDHDLAVFVAPADPALRGQPIGARLQDDGVTATVLR